MLDDGAEATARFVILATGVLSVPLMPDIPGVERFGGQWFHTAGLAPRAGRPLRQTCRRDRDRRDRRAADHGDREDGGQPHGLPAHTELVRSVAQRADRCGRAGVDPRALCRDVRTVPQHVRRLHPRCGSTQGARGLRGGTHRLLRGALRAAGLRHLDGQLPRCAGGRRGQRDAERVHGRQDPRASRRPEGRRDG